ncbi:MAG: type II secretion system minor pseudopilin GspJ [Gammaproteobacteria bacterium]|jgi:general secretion pathway protein J
MMRRRAAAAAGFTLLELLVALAIFSLLAVMSYGGLRTVLQQQALTEAAAERLGTLQKTYLIMQRDIEQAVPRPIRDEYGDTQPALAGSDMLQLTRGGWNNPLHRRRSSLQRVGYVRQDRELVRYVWQVLDRAQDSEPLEQVLLENIDAMEIRYLDARNEWHDQWPVATLTAAPGELPDLPAAVEVTLDHEHYGPLVWLFRLPQ